MAQHPVAATPRWRVCPDAAALCDQAAAMIGHRANACIEERGRFSIVLAGGNTPREVYRRLRGLHTDWAAWWVFYGDERCLPPDDPGRNSRMAQDAWLGHVPIPPAQIHTIPAELGPQQGAAAYAAMLAGEGAFDLVLLGVGEDGHTASLFPGHEWGTAADAPAALAVPDAPKPPPGRVSLSAWRLSCSRQVMFLVSGDSKCAAVAAWRAGEAIPAAAITAQDGVDVLVEAVCLGG